MTDKMVTFAVVPFLHLLFILPIAHTHTHTHTNACTPAMSKVPKHQNSFRWYISTRNHHVATVMKKSFGTLN